MEEEQNIDSESLKSSLGILCLFLLVVTLLSPFVFATNVQHGCVGIVINKTNGEVHDEFLNPGVHFYKPWKQTVYVFRVYPGYAKEIIPIRFSNGFDGFVNVTAYFGVNPSYAVEIFKKCKRDCTSDLVFKTIGATMVDVLADFTLKKFSLLSDYEMFSTLCAEKASAILTPLGIDLENLSIERIISN